jgi:glucose/arabinose dehydrogenase
MKILSAVCCVVAAGVLMPNRVDAQRLEAQPAYTGLAAPVAFVAIPGNSGFAIVEKGGRLRYANGGVLGADILDLSVEVATAGEGGLLGLAFDPSYTTNGRFFVLYTRRGATSQEFGDIVVERFNRIGPNSPTADLASRRKLRWGGIGGPDYIEHSQFSNHVGGTLQFGPDGYLYIGLGDGGSSNDPGNNAQNPASRLGKMLRIDVDVPDGDQQGYQVPADNPFVDGNPIAALPEIWAFGLRNPWKFSFDDPARGGTGALIIGDVGQNRWEEVDYEPAAAGGRNYGWRIREGAHDNPDVPATVPAFLPLTEPAFEYGHTPGVAPVAGASVTGGYVYRGSDLTPFWRGRYFFADFVSQRVWSANVAAANGAFSNLLEHTPSFNTGGVSSFGVDHRGELYVVSYTSGTVSRICELSVAPGVTSFAANGGSGTVSVTTASECAWSVDPGVPWIFLATNTQERGIKTAIFRVFPNTTGTARNATLNIAGSQVTITQSAMPPVLGDIDGTTSGDLLWQHADGRLATWLMSGTALRDGRPLTTSFGPAVLADPTWRMAAFGDFDGDGSRDILFQRSNGELAMWFMSGSMVLLGRPLIPPQVADTNWIVRAAGDMNRDGFADIIWQHQVTGDLAVWFMEGNRQLGGRLLTPGNIWDVNWHIVGTGDINGDGHPDVVWQNRVDGRLVVWFMDGFTRNGAAQPLSPGQVPDTGWRLAGPR